MVSGSSSRTYRYRVLSILHTDSHPTGEQHDECATGTLPDVESPGYPSIGYATIDRLAAEVDPGLRALRRDIHEHPELAGNEVRTAALVAERLRAAGLAVSTGVGGQGIVAVLSGGGDAGGRTVAYRADMDAVETDDGATHLCGHDLHTAVGVGVAEVLARLRERLPGRVAFLFQPAEETLAGAQAMIADGVLERTRPAEIYALHCAPLPVGSFAVMPGFGHPGLDLANIELAGPTALADAVRIVAGIEALSTISPPTTEAEFDQLASDLQTPDGPLARFVLTGARLEQGVGDEQRVAVRAWLRAWPDDRYPSLREEIRELVRSAPHAVVDFPAPPFPAMICAPEQSHAMAAHLSALDCVESVAVLHASYPFNGEDFALYLQRVPGAMAFLGVADEEAGILGIPHAPDFAADDRAIGVAVRSMASLLASRLTA